MTENHPHQGFYQESEPLEFTKDREVIGILGKTGQGKSQWLKRYLVGKKRLMVFDPVQDIPVQYVNEHKLVEMHMDRNFEVPFPVRVGISDPDHIPMLVSLAFLNGKMVLVTEEAAIAFPSNAARLDSWWRESIFLGRHRDLSIIITAQRAVSIPVALRSQFTRVVSFAQQEHRDMDWLSDYFGERTGEIPELQKMECLDSNNGVISRYSIPIIK